MASRTLGRRRVAFVGVLRPWYGVRVRDADKSTRARNRFSIACLCRGGL